MAQPRFNRDAQVEQAIVIQIVALARHGILVETAGVVQQEMCRALLLFVATVQQRFRMMVEPLQQFLNLVLGQKMRVRMLFQRVVNLHDLHNAVLRIGISDFLAFGQECFADHGRVDS